MKWHFQFTPNDGYDYDSVQIPVLADITFKGTPSKVMMWANRGYFYVLDRRTGKFLLGEPFVKVNWSSGLDANGRPIPTRQPARHAHVSGQSGRHELVSPLQPAHGAVLRLSAWENYGTIYRPEESPINPGATSPGGGFTVATPVPGAPTIGIGRRGPYQQLDR